MISHNDLKNLTIRAVGATTLMLSSVGAAFATSHDKALEVKAPTLGITNLGNFISALIRASIIIAALLTFAYLIWGGIQWLTSGGDKSAYEAARGRITAALIGLAIVAAAYAIMLIIGTFFNVDILGSGLNFGNANLPN
jgi:uncharacterized membrane protein